MAIALRPGQGLTLVEMRMALRHYLMAGDPARASWVADKILDLIYPDRWKG